MILSVCLFVLGKNQNQNTLLLLQVKLRNFFTIKQQMKQRVTFLHNWYFQLLIFLLLKINK